MTDINGSAASSQYAVVAPISVSDISPSRRTRESSNKFLQEHTIISELNTKKDRLAGKLKYVDVEFTNSATEQREQITKKEGHPGHGNVNTNYEDWTVPRMKSRKQPPPPPPTKPKTMSKAKSVTQMVVPEETGTTMLGETTIKTKAKCASESDIIDEDQIQQVHQPINSLRRPSRKAPPPPNQLRRAQTNKEFVTLTTTRKTKLPNPLQLSGGDKDVIDLAPLSPNGRRALSSEKEIVETSSRSPEGHQVKRTSSFKEGKVIRPVRKAPPPPNKSTEYINVVKDNDVTSSTFLVSHKKAQSLSYENVADASLSTVPRSFVYENQTVEKGRKLHRSDEGQHGHSYENVATAQTTDDKLNKVLSSKPNSADMNKIDDVDGATTQHQETAKSNASVNYQKQSGKKKSVRKKRNISPPHTPPPPPPEVVGESPMSPPEATRDLTAASSPSLNATKLKKPSAPPPPPPGETRALSTPPPRPPPPDEAQLVNGEVPPRPPPPPPDEPRPDESRPLSTEELISKRQPNVTLPTLKKTVLDGAHARVADSMTEVKGEKQVFTAASALSKPLSPPIIMAKRPPTSPPAIPPPPPPPPPSVNTSMTAVPHSPPVPSEQKRVSFEIPSRDDESAEEDNNQSISSSSSEASLHNQQVIIQQKQHNGDAVNDLHVTVSTNHTTSPDFFGQPTGELEEHPNTKPSVTVHATNTTHSSEDSKRSPDDDDGGDDDALSKGRRESRNTNPFWYRESMIMAVGRGNALYGYPSKKRPVPPPRTTQSIDQPLIETMESSPVRVRRSEEDAKNEGNDNDVEINLAYTESPDSASSTPCPMPPPRANNKEIKPSPPPAPPRDKSTFAKSPEKSKATYTRVRAASFLTVSAGKELNTVNVMYMGSRQVDQYVGQINNIARDLSEKAAFPMIMYIATEKIRLAAPDSSVLFASYAVENILVATLCSINKRIVGMLVWKSRTLPSWHLIRCSDNLVAGSVLESIQMACETVKSDEIMEVRPLSQTSLPLSGNQESLSEHQASSLFRKFPAIFISNVKVGSAISVNEIIAESLFTLFPSTSIEIELWLSVYQVRLINFSNGMMFAQYDMSDIKLFGTLARDKRYLGIVVGNVEKKQPTMCVMLRCRTLSHVVTILSYLREACQVSYQENRENPLAWSNQDDPEEAGMRLEDENDDDEDEQFALEILKTFSGQSKSNTVPSPSPNRKTLKERLKTLKGTLTAGFDKSPSGSVPYSVPVESTFKSHIQGGDSPITSPAKGSDLSLLSNPEEYARFTMCYIGSATLDGVVTGSTVFDALQAIEEGGVAAGAALVPKNQISFVVSAMGVTLLDSTQKMFITRHYPKNQIEAFLRGPDRSSVLGFVTKKKGFEDKIKCHLFSEVTEPLSQIYSAVEYWLKLDNETLV